MERRKFLANLVCLGVGASLAPKVIGEEIASEPSVDPRVFDYPLTEKECYKPPDGLVLGCITSLNGNEIVIHPLSGLEGFPALKKGDKAILFSNRFFRNNHEYLSYYHEEKESERYIIVVQEDIPYAGEGLPITLKLNAHALSHLSIHDYLIFLK